ncbi:glycosyltransferase family 25 protein [Providencia rettgeri]
MKTFVINLVERPDRKKFMQDQLNNSNLNYQFIEAVDGRTLSNDEINSITLNFHDSYLTRGEVGCALSHLKAYKKIVDENIDMALILEDDAVLPSNLSSIAHEIESIDKKNNPNIYLLSDVFSYIKNSPLTKNIYRINDATKAHGYIINKLAAKRLLDKLYPIRYEADMWTVFNFFNYANIYCVQPHVINVVGDGDKEDSNLEIERSLFVTKRYKQRRKQMKLEPYYQFYRLKDVFFRKKFLTTVRN